MSGFSSGVARAHVRKDDTVLVRRGRDRGKTGKVLTVLLKTGQVFVEKLNLVKRHTKPSPQNKQGGSIEKEGPIALSNVMLVCPKCNKAARSGKKVLASGGRVRVCKNCGETIDRG